MATTSTTAIPGSGTFARGVHPDGRKALSAGAAVEVLPTPKSVLVPLLQHTGAACEPTVKTKDEVFARWLLGPQMRKLMLEEKGAKWYIVGEQLCLVYQAGLTAKKFRPSVERLHRFWAALPTTDLEAEETPAELVPANPQ